MWMNFSLVAKVTLDLRSFVDNRAAYPTLAELGGRKQEHNRFFS